MLFLYKCVYSCVYLYILSDYIYIYIYIVAVIEDPESSGGPSCEAIWHFSTPTQNSSVISQCFQGVLKQVPDQCQLAVHQAPSSLPQVCGREGSLPAPSGQIPALAQAVLGEHQCTLSRSISRCIKKEEVRNLSPSEVLQYKNLTTDEDYMI